MKLFPLLHSSYVNFLTWIMGIDKINVYPLAHEASSLRFVQLVFSVLSILISAVLLTKSPFNNKQQ